MSTHIKYLRLYLHQPDGQKQAIGYLSQYGEILRVSFDDAYINDPTRPTLSLSYQGADDGATRKILQATRDARVVHTDGRWPVYFQNLLPEGHNRDRLAKERHCDPDEEFELLAAAGHDLMGAMEVEPLPPYEGIPDVVRHWHTAMGLDVLEPGFVEYPVEDAAAIPGVVDKFSAVLDGRRYVVRKHGAAGSFILKLPSSRHPDLVANEFTGFRLCGALQLDCAQATIISRADAELPEVVPFEQILAVKRFDRAPDGRRVHMEEFAQVLGYAPKNKYGKGIDVDYVTMLRVLNTLSSNPVHDVREFIGRFVAFILMGNTDAHLKNWALVYPDGRIPQLAPLYDPVCVSALFRDVPANHYAVNRKIDETLIAFGWTHLEGLLAKAGVPRIGNHLRIAKTLVRQAKAEWPALLVDAPDSVRREVTERLNGAVALAQ